MVKIKIHSIIDVITNSSSELFICDTDKSLEIIKELLQDMLDLYNKGNDTNYKFDEVFSEPYLYTKEDVDKEKQDLEEWNKKGYGWNGYGYEGKEENIGKIVIESKDDNSIPFDLMELIEGMFDARRYHLG